MCPRVFFVFFAVFAPFFLVSCPQNKKALKTVYFKMDTVIEITLYENEKNKKARMSNDEIFAKIENFLADWDERFSPSSSKSEILACNERDSDTVKISHDLYEMLKIALSYSQKTDGFFDVTVKPLKDFWNVSGISNTGDENENLPDPEDPSVLDALAQILKNVDYTKISLLDSPERAIFENPKTRIDLGGIAKGFAIDKLADTLKKYGYFDFIINVGGDVFVSGTKSGGKPITVGVRHPRQTGEILQTFKISSEAAVVTSGDYERFRIAPSGARVHNIFNVETGFPVRKNISLTVKGERAVVADILATGLFALSAQEIGEKMKGFSGYEFVVVDSTQTLLSSFERK